MCTVHRVGAAVPPVAFTAGYPDTVGRRRSRWVDAGQYVARPPWVGPPACGQMAATRQARQRSHRRAARRADSRRPRGPAGLSSLAGARAWGAAGKRGGGGRTVSARQ